jgi:hypothetical protein
VKHIRVTVDTGIGSAPPAIDAVEMQGYYEAPPDVLRTVGNKVPVTYVPLSGIHVSKETAERFTVELYDSCPAAEGASSVLPIYIQSTRPASSQRGSFWRTNRHNVVPFTRVSVRIDTSEPLAHLHSVVNDGMWDPSSGTNVSVSQVRISQHSSNNDTIVFLVGVSIARHSHPSSCHFSACILIVLASCRPAVYLRLRARLLVVIFHAFRSDG